MKEPDNTSLVENLFNNEKLLFSIVLILEIFYFWWLISGRRMVCGHDGFQQYSLQYFFLNNAVVSGNIPQWVPYYMQGSVASWWYSIQGGFLQDVFLFLACLLKNINFYYLFNLNMFFDELVLVIGCWLWGKLFFHKMITTFFFTVTVLGSTIWLTQPLFNFHFFYSIPLILYFMHLYLEKNKLLCLFLSLNLFVIQSLGNQYFFPMISLIVFLYFLLYVIFNTTAISHFFRMFKPSWRFMTCLLATGVFFYLLYLVTMSGADHIANYNIGRRADGSVSLHQFLTYGGNLNFIKWQELFLGISPELDYTLYAGIIFCPLICLSLFSLQRKYAHVYCLVLILLFISVGLPIANLFYYGWPLMKIYRHLALISPTIKLFLCFIASIGFEAIVKHYSAQNVNNKKYPYLLVPIVFIFAVFTWYAHFTETSLARHLESLISRGRGDLIVFERSYEVFDMFRLNLSLFLSLLLLALFILLMVSSKKNISFFVLLIILTLHVMDIYSYKYNETVIRSVPIRNNGLFKMTSFQPMPYRSRRETNFWKNNPRAQFIESLPLKVVLYGHADAFTFQDEVGNSFRTQQWMVPLDKYMRSYWHQDINDRSIKPQGLTYFKDVKFPLGHMAARKFSGIDEDKIQFFKDAYYNCNEQLTSRIVSSGSYAGDVPVICPDIKSFETQSPIKFSLNARVLIPYHIEHFDANELTFTYNSPMAHGWLVYSDVWDPGWRASVNGKQVSVLKANLAYKAIPIIKGINEVHFYFNSLPVMWAQTILNINALFWVMGVFLLIFQVYAGFVPWAK